jgi:hypothetical protein
MAVDAVPCELFSAPDSLLTGKFTGNIVSLAEVLRDKSSPENPLAGKTRFSRPSGTGNDQGMNRESNSLIPLSTGSNPTITAALPNNDPYIYKG